jgi:hypothetical protein
MRRRPQRFALHHCGDRRWDRACGSHGHRPRQGASVFLGRAGFEGKSADELNNNDLIRKFYLGL